MLFTNQEKIDVDSYDSVIATNKMQQDRYVEDIRNFIIESNKIESIYRNPTQEEIDEMRRFMALTNVTVEDLEAFVKVYQSDARLRDEYGLDIRVGSYYPPFGGPDIREQLKFLLDQYSNVPLHLSYGLHVKYEKLHPFTDGNGRSGRALWAHRYRDISRGFLLPFYFQTLEHTKCE